MLTVEREGPGNTFRYLSLGSLCSKFSRNVIGINRNVIGKPRKPPEWASDCSQQSLGVSQVTCKMAGAKFEYDDKGTTFYYFLISFYGLILVPLTYYVLFFTKVEGEWFWADLEFKKSIFSRLSFMYQVPSLRRRVIWSVVLTDSLH